MSGPCSEDNTAARSIKFYNLLFHFRIPPLCEKYLLQSAYAQHILQNLHVYGSITDTMSLLKPMYKTLMLIPFEQLFIQTFHHNVNLITEQGTGEQNPLFQFAIDTMLTSAKIGKQKQFNTPHTTHSHQFQLFHDSSRQQ